MKTILIITIIAISILSCKKEIDGQSEVTQKALQGAWVQDSSWIYEILTNPNPEPDDTLFLLTNYNPQNFVIDKEEWTNATSEWSSDFLVFEDYVLTGGTRYNIENLTSSSFSLVRIPFGEFTTTYTRWFSR